VKRDVEQGGDHHHHRGQRDPQDHALELGQGAASAIGHGLTTGRRRDRSVTCMLVKID
jgi:hypothetical protein